MLTSSSRTVVSLISLGASLSLGGCVRLSSPAVATMADAPAPAEIRFDNDAEVSVDVYLVSERSEWRLGRVAPGARVMLRIPNAATAASTGFLRLATLADAPLTVNAARDARAVLTIAQPLTELLSQEWMFSLRQTASPQLLGMRANGLRP